MLSAGRLKPRFDVENLDLDIENLDVNSELSIGIRTLYDLVLDGRERSRLRAIGKRSWVE